MDWIWCVCVWERQWVKRSLINNTPEWGPLHTRPQVHTEALTWHSVCSVALQSCSILFYSLLSTVTHTLTHSHTQILQTVSTVFCPHGKRPHVRWVKSTSVCLPCIDCFLFSLIISSLHMSMTIPGMWLGVLCRHGHVWGKVSNPGYALGFQFPLWGEDTSWPPSRLCWLTQTGNAYVHENSKGILWIGMRCPPMWWRSAT